MKNVESWWEMGDRNIDNNKIEGEEIERKRKRVSTTATSTTTITKLE